jgi:hypothetical protein
VLAEQERYPEALLRYNQSYEIHKSLNDRRNMAYSLMNRGDVLWRLGRYDEARDSLAQALELANQPDNLVKLVIAEVPLHYAQMALSERHFPEARLKSQQAIELAGTQHQGIAIEAKYTLCLAQALSGDARSGVKSCEESVEMAKGAGDAGLLSRAMLALAESSLEAGDAQASLTNALQVQQSFNRAGQLESEWRAWMIAARASRLKRDERAASEQMAEAVNVLSQLRQKWGDEAFNGYLSRPDIQFSRKQLGEAVPLPEK